MFSIEGEYNTATVYAKELEKSAIAQIRNLCNQAFAANSLIRIMPDAHGGDGCVIGTTMTVTDKIVPNLVGVDISCGVEAVNIGNVDFDPELLDKVIRERVPSGFDSRKEKHALSSDADLENLCCADTISLEKAARAVGTLGGGNHFIEVDKAENGDHWLVIHSGSRHPGLLVAGYHQKIAQQLHPEVNKDLAWLEGQAFDNYVHDMKIMQKYADLNRLAISLEILDGMGWQEKDRFTTIHNYLDTDTMILRKGAVSAQKGQRLLVPINMRDGTLLCEGKGNENWNCSSPHGAGRLMSRGDARRNLSMDDFRTQMQGVFTTSVCENTLDEAPDAYKPIADILETIGETAELLSIMKPVYNFKASQSGGRRRRG